MCRAPGRDDSLICIVEQATDVLPLERSGAYRGLYHCLRGRISPLENVGPSDLRIAELVERVRAGQFEEVIIAIGSDVEGEATANYLSEMLGSTGVRLSRLAQGLPVGGGLDAADELTLNRALEGRRTL